MRKAVLWNERFAGVEVFVYSLPHLLFDMLTQSVGHRRLRFGRLTGDEGEKKDNQQD